MNINDFCGIELTATLFYLVAMFVALIIKINRQPKRKLQQASRGGRAEVTIADERHAGEPVVGNSASASLPGTIIARSQALPAEG